MVGAVFGSLAKQSWLLGIVTLSQHYGKLPRVLFYYMLSLSAEAGENSGIYHLSRMVANNSCNNVQCAYGKRISFDPSESVPSILDRLELVVPGKL